MTKKHRLRLVEEAYLKKILGFDYEEVKTIEEYDENEQLLKRKVEISKKHSPPDDKALHEYLCKNAPEKWGDIVRTEENPGGGVVILPEVAENE